MNLREMALAAAYWRGYDGNRETEPDGRDLGDLLGEEAGELEEDVPEYPTCRAEQEADDARNPRYDLNPADELVVSAGSSGSRAE